MSTAERTYSAHLHSDVAPFRQRAPWWGGDLQTLRNVLVGRPPRLTSWPGRRLVLAMNDGTGDRLVASAHASEAVGRPLVVLIHGLTGCEDSHYVRASARHFLKHGYPVLRLNLRGAGPSQPLCREKYHAGRSEDLSRALAALPRALTRRGVLPIGFSLGGNMLLKWLAEPPWPVTVRAAAVISAPIDLKATQLRMMAPRNSLYHGYILRRMKAEWLASPDSLSDLDAYAIQTARDVFDFDEHVVSPRNGFAGADDYYARCSGLRFLADVGAPTLVIHARNDPWIPAAPYLAFDWRRNENLTPMLPAGGGHVGFHGPDGGVAWHDKVIADHFARLAA